MSIKQIITNPTCLNQMYKMIRESESYLPDYEVSSVTSLNQRMVEEMSRCTPRLQEMVECLPSLNQSAIDLNDLHFSRLDINSSSNGHQSLSEENMLSSVLDDMSPAWTLQDVTGRFENWQSSQDEEKSN